MATHSFVGCGIIHTTPNNDTSFFGEALPNCESVAMTGMVLLDFFLPNPNLLPKHLTTFILSRLSLTTSLSSPSTS